MTDHNSQTPTRYDLARWLFEKLDEVDEPCKDYVSVLSRMNDCIQVVREAEKPLTKNKLEN